MTDNPQDPQNTGGTPADPAGGAEFPPASEGGQVPPAQPEQPGQGATPAEPSAPADPAAPQQPGYGQPQQPGYQPPQAPPQPPAYGQPQQPSYGAGDQGFGASSGAPQQPGYGTPPVPPAPQFGASSGAPEQPPYGQQPPTYGQQPPQQPGYGQQPPQQPGYGAPAGGGFPAAPPPPGSYGQYGGPAGAGGPWGAPQAFSATEAVGWGFRAYGSNVGYWLLIMLGLVVVGGILSLVLSPFGAVTDGGFSASYDAFAMSGTERIMSAILGLILTALGLVLVQGALHKANGRLNSLGDFFSFQHLVPGLVAAVVVGLASNLVGLVPGIGRLLQVLVTVLTIFVVPLALDRGLAIGDALSQGVKLVTSNLGQVVLLYLIFIGLVIAGVIVICGTGLLFVVIPVGSLATVYAYKLLSGQQVAPV